MKAWDTMAKPSQAWLTLAACTAYLQQRAGRVARFLDRLVGRSLFVATISLGVVVMSFSNSSNNSSDYICSLLGVLVSFPGVITVLFNFDLYLACIRMTFVSLWLNIIEF